jgi:hypothetical protein
VDNGIVRVTLKPDARIGPSHPQIERIVHEQIGQQRTHHAMDTKDNFVFERRIRLRRAVAILDLRREQ